MELNTAESSQGYPSSITSPRREQRVVYVVNRIYRDRGEEGTERRFKRRKSRRSGPKVLERYLKIIASGPMMFWKNFRRKFHYPAT